MSDDAVTTADYQPRDVVDVWYPDPGRPALQGRDEWTWLRGTIIARCDEVGHEFHVRVDDERLAEWDEEDDEVTYYPACFRTPDELRRPQLPCDCPAPAVESDGTCQACCRRVERT